MSLPKLSGGAAIIVVVSLVAYYLMVAPAGAWHHQVQVVVTPPNESQMAAQRKALAAGGLPAAAAVTGQYFDMAPMPEVGGPATLEEFIDNSSDIVVAWVLQHSMKLSANQLTIFTYYDVQLEQVLKGALTNGEEITIIVPGGRVTFADGSMAQVNTPGFHPPLNGRRYVWFLRRAPSSRAISHENLIQPGGAFSPTDPKLGIYDVTESSIVQPSGYFSSPVARQIRAKRLLSDDFVRVLSAMITKGGNRR